MGQYFAAVNKNKKEFVCPWCIGGGAKLWEWAANAQGAIFTLLLRKSDESGGGDYGSTPTQILSIEDDSQSLAKAVLAGVAQEGQPIALPDGSVVGRWAGDSVVLIGDYDSSETWDKLYRQNKNRYRNISKELVETWNDFIEIDSMKLKYLPCNSCTEADRE